MLTASPVTAQTPFLDASCHQRQQIDQVALASCLTSYHVLAELVLLFRLPTLAVGRCDARRLIISPIVNGSSIMATQLTPEQQAYYQGLADYEAAIHAQSASALGQLSESDLAQAQMLEAQELEAQMAEAQALEAHLLEAQALEAQLLEAQMVEAELAGGAANLDALHAHAIAQYDTALLHHKLALEEALAGMEAAYHEGMAAYEHAMVTEAALPQSGEEAQQSPDAERQGMTPDAHAAYLQGLVDFEIDLLAKAAAERAAQLPPELREAYDKGRAAYEKAMAAQSGTSDAQGEEGAQSETRGENTSETKRRRRSRSR